MLRAIVFESLKNLVLVAKEGALEAGAQAYLNQEIQHFGTVTHLKIDSQRKTMRLEAALKGEADPIAVMVSSYEVTTNAGAAYIVVNRFEASREWIAVLLNAYVAGRRFQIPPGLGAVL